MPEPSAVPSSPSPASASPAASAPAPSKNTAADYAASAEALNASLVWRARHEVRRQIGLWQIRRSGFAVSQLPSPVFIGATGGSGTRAVAQILQTAGINVGMKHNFALDAMDFVPFVVRWTRSFCTTGEAPRAMDGDFDVSVFRFRRGMRPDEPWAAKAPRFIYFLPYLERRFPGMKFIHLVRDGRDMALAPNQSQLRDYGSFLLDSSLDGAPEPVRSIALWARINTEARRYGEQSLSGRYLLVRFEDLCADPAAEVERIFRFLGLDASRDEAAACVRRQQSTGRWQSAPADLISQMSATAGEALREFAYL